MLSLILALSDMSKHVCNNVHQAEKDWTWCKLFGQQLCETSRHRLLLNLFFWLVLSKTGGKCYQTTRDPTPAYKNKHAIRLSESELCSFLSSAWQHLIFIEGERRREWNNSGGTASRVILHCNYDLDAGSEGALRARNKRARNVCTHTDHTHTRTCAHAPSHTRCSHGSFMHPQATSGCTIGGVIWDQVRCSASHIPGCRHRQAALIRLFTINICWCQCGHLWENGFFFSSSVKEFRPTYEEGHQKYVDVAGAGNQAWENRRFRAARCSCGPWFCEKSLTIFWFVQECTHICCTCM